MNWHEYFTYDESTGNLIWKSRTPRNGVAFNSRCAGKVAGCKSTAKKRVGARGPVMVLVNYHHTTAHRIIWEMHYGPVPEGLTIDHIDRDPHNNRLSNLRLATYEENNRNRGSFRHNKSGVKGVFWEKDRSLWKAMSDGIFMPYNVGACRSAPVRWACVEGRIVASVCCTA